MLSSNGCGATLNSKSQEDKHASLVIQGRGTRPWKQGVFPTNKQAAAHFKVANFPTREDDSETFNFKLSAVQLVKINTTTMIKGMPKPKPLVLKGIGRGGNSTSASSLVHRNTQVVNENGVVKNRKSAFKYEDENDDEDGKAAAAAAVFNRQRYEEYQKSLDTDPQPSTNVKIATSSASEAQSLSWSELTNRASHLKVTELDQKPNQTIVLIKNLPFGIELLDIETFFTVCGTINNVEMPCFEDSHRSKGTATLTFSDADGASKCLALNNTIMGERPLSITIFEEEEDKKLLNNSRKIKLCDRWEETGTCDYGDSCWYAHGNDELKLHRAKLFSEKKPKKKGKERIQSEDMSMNKSDFKNQSQNMYDAVVDFVRRRNGRARLSDVGQICGENDCQGKKSLTQYLVSLGFRIEHNWVCFDDINKLDVDKMDDFDKNICDLDEVNVTIGFGFGTFTKDELEEQERLYNSYHKNMDKMMKEKRLEEERVRETEAIQAKIHLRLQQAARVKKEEEDRQRKFLQDAIHERLEQSRLRATNEEEKIVQKQLNVKNEKQKLLDGYIYSMHYEIKNIKKKQEQQQQQQHVPINVISARSGGPPPGFDTCLGSARVTHHYQAQNTNELSLTPGEPVFVLEVSADQLWLRVCNTNSQRSGWVKSSCLDLSPFKKVHTLQRDSQHQQYQQQHHQQYGIDNQQQRCYNRQQKQQYQQQYQQQQVHPLYINTYQGPSQTCLPCL